MSFAPSTPLLNLVLSLGLTFWLLLTLLVLNRITWHWVVRPLSGVLFSDRRRTIWYHLTLFPGTVIHECSHLLACWLLLVPVLEFQPFSLDSERSPGWVRHQRTDPFRAAMIGLAPFLGGSVALLLLSHLFPAFYAPDWFQGLQAPAPDNLLFLGGHLIRLVWDLLSQANYLDWQTWLFLYLVLSIGLQAAPSSTDLQALPGGLLLVVALLGGCYLLGLGLNIDWATWPFVTDALIFLTDVLMALNRLFAYSAALILLMLIPIVPLAWLLSHL